MAYTVMKYLRISAEDIDLDGFDKFESNSIANQRALLDDFIGRVPELAGCEALEELDNGRTGKNFNRPGVQRVIELAKAGRIHCIIVKDLSRWGRSYIEVGDYLEQIFPALGVRFISLNDNYDSATLHGMTGGIDIAFRNLIYDLYSQDLSEKVKSAKNGKFTNAEVFYGYIRDPKNQRTLIPDEPTAIVVRRIFELFAQGKTSSAIAKILNDGGVITPVERRIELGSHRRFREGEARFWYSRLVQRIVTDERYTGKLIYGKTHAKEVCGRQYPTPKEDWVVVPNAFPAIISEEEFAAAQAYTKERSNPNHSISPTKLLFARKIRCGCCGKTLKTIHRTRDVKYYCTTPSFKNEYGCMTEKVFEKDIAAAVLSALQLQVSLAIDASQAIERKNKKLTPKIDLLRGKVYRLKQLIEKSKTVKVDLWEQYHSGKLTAEAFQKENERADALAVERIAKVAEPEIPKLESKSGRENLFVERFSKQVGITELTQDIVKEFVREVKVYSHDRIEVVFNFDNEYRRIADIMGANESRRSIRK